MCCCSECDGRRCCSWWRIVQSALGIFVGLSSAFVFYHVYGNAQASGWAFTSAIFAAACLHLAVLLHKQTLVHWYSTSHLWTIQLLGFIPGVISVAAFSWYIFYAAYYKIPMIPVDNSAIVTSVWVFMTAKWAWLLWAFARLGVRATEFYESLSESEP